MQVKLLECRTVIVLWTVVLIVASGFNFCLVFCQGAFDHQRHHHIFFFQQLCAQE